MTSNDAMSIPAGLLVHIRVALLGAWGILVEDLGILSPQLEATNKSAVGASLPDEYVAFHELMQALQSSYELQRTIGLPGEPLQHVKVRPPAHQVIVIEVLTQYRDAMIQLQADSDMGEYVCRDAAARLPIIEAFLKEFPKLAEATTEGPPDAPNAGCSVGYD